MIGEIFEILCSLILISIAIPVIFFTLSVYIEKQVVERELKETLRDTIKYLRKVAGDRQIIVDGFPYVLKVLKNAAEQKSKNSKINDEKGEQSNVYLKTKTLIYFSVFSGICFLLIVIILLNNKIKRSDVSIMSIIFGIIIFVLVEVVFVILVVQYYRVTDMRHIVTNMLQAIPNEKKEADSDD